MTVFHIGKRVLFRVAPEEYVDINKALTVKGLYFALHTGQTPLPLLFEQPAIAAGTCRYVYSPCVRLGWGVGPCVLVDSTL